MKSVLVTGATGFLGKYLVEECLGLGYKVIAFGRNESIGRALESDKVIFVKGDLSQSSDLEKAFALGVNKVIHAGALSTVWGAWQSFYASNVLGTKHVVELCQTYDVECFVYVSSPSIYAKGQELLNLTEASAPLVNTLTPYIRSKLMAEEVIRKAEGLNYVIARPRGIFGIGDTSIIPRILELNRKARVPLIRQGQHVIDISCAENVAYAIGLMLEKKEALGQVYNITNGESMTFKEILLAFFDHMEEEPRFIPLPDFLASGLASLFDWTYRLFKITKEPPLTRYTYYLLRYSQTLSIEKAKQELGYEPKMTIREGIEKYVRHQKS